MSEQLGIGWRGRKAMLALAALGLICAACAGEVSYGPPRVLAGLLLALGLPGYGLAALALRRPAAAAEVALCAIGASIVSCIVVGLALYVLPLPMSRGAWALALGALVVLTALLAALREGREGRPGSAVALADGEQAGASGLPLRLPAAPGVLLATAALALAAAGVLVARDAADRASPFMEVGAVPATIGSTHAVAVEVRSHESHAVSLRLLARGTGRRARALRLTLAPGQAWHATIAAPRPSPRGVELRLIPVGAGVPLLRTVTYLPVRAGSTAPSSRTSLSQEHRGARSGSAVRLAETLQEIHGALSVAEGR